MEERPKYIIKVDRRWRYSRNTRFWKIMEWRDVPDSEDGGYWNSIYSGISYTKFGMRWAINRGLKKIAFGNHTDYFNLDGSTFKGIK